MGSKAGGLGMVNTLISVIHIIFRPLMSYSGLLVCPAMYAGLFSYIYLPLQSSALECFVRFPSAAQLRALHGVLPGIKQFLSTKSSLVLITILKTPQSMHTSSLLSFSSSLVSYTLDPAPPLTRLVEWPSYVSRQASACPWPFHWRVEEDTWLMPHTASDDGVSF